MLLMLLAFILALWLFSTRKEHMTDSDQTQIQSGQIEQLKTESSRLTITPDVVSALDAQNTSNINNTATLQTLVGQKTTNAYE